MRIKSIAFTRVCVPTLLCSMLLASNASAQSKVNPDQARAIDTKSKIYGGGFGKWVHLGMSSPKGTDIVAPNNDTPYSWAWVDVRAEPWVLTLPKIEAKRF